MTDKDQTTQDNGQPFTPPNWSMPQWSSEDWAQLSAVMKAATDQTSGMMQTYMDTLPKEQKSALDPLNIMSGFYDYSKLIMEDPMALVNQQKAFFDDSMKLWDYATKAESGQKPDPIIDSSHDKRFQNPLWSENTGFDLIKQAYLLLAKHMMVPTEQMEGLDDKSRQKVDFYIKQMVDAISPSNFMMLNPEVLVATMESGGQNLINGLQNLIADLQENEGRAPLISLVDKSAFKLGENIAATPGKVVFRNDLIELIQYSPTTDDVKKIPMVFFPPWINKYYILDLNHKKSMVRWMVDQGYTVFMVSWVNPKAAHRHKGLKNYLHEGYIEAIKVAQEITGEKAVHTTGYCVGGTMLSAALAYMQVTDQAKMVKSATFLTTLTDFSQAGELTVFIDDDQIAAMKQSMKEKGYMDGKALALTFNMLRSNDLIWSYMVNNYLLGKKPTAFDLLYWNSDSTNQAEACHGEYLEEMYLKNTLREPGGLVLDGVPIDLRSIDIPTYILATKDDHIAPASSVYALRHLTSGPARFVLGGSGHIAGVINPPLGADNPGKYQYWTNDRKAEDLTDFLTDADQHAGSWWQDWRAWLDKRSQATTKARIPGQGGYECLYDAPGDYVKEKA